MNIINVCARGGTYPLGPPLNPPLDGNRVCILYGKPCVPYHRAVIAVPAKKFAVDSFVFREVQNAGNGWLRWVNHAITREQNFTSKNLSIQNQANVAFYLYCSYQRLVFSEQRGMLVTDEMTHTHTHVHTHTHTHTHKQTTVCLWGSTHQGIMNLICTVKQAMHANFVSRVKSQVAHVVQSNCAAGCRLLTIHLAIVSGY